MRFLFSKTMPQNYFSLDNGKIKQDWRYQAEYSHWLLSSIKSVLFALKIDEFSIKKLIV